MGFVVQTLSCEKGYGTLVVLQVRSPRMLNHSSFDPSPLDPDIRLPQVEPVADVDFSEASFGVGGGDEYVAMLAQQARLQSGRDGHEIRVEQSTSRRLEVPQGPPYRFNHG